jgi:hypothetical protein
VDNPKPLSFLSFLPAAIFLALVGWGGLAALIFYTLPTLGPRWLFFFLAVIALTGTSLPVVYFFNRRFPSTPPAEPGVYLRQAIWVGVYAGTLAWLQLGRMLSGRFDPDRGPAAHARDQPLETRCLSCAVSPRWTSSYRPSRLPS